MAEAYYDQTLAGRIGDRLTKEIEKHTQDVINGLPHTLERYREMVGVLRGLATALDLVAEVRKEMAGG